MSTLTKDPIARIGSVITITTGGTCPTINELFPNGDLWYAYYNSADVNFNCCGTTLIPL